MLIKKNGHGRGTCCNFWWLLEILYRTSLTQTNNWTNYQRECAIPVEKVGSCFFHRASRIYSNLSKDPAMALIIQFAWLFSGRDGDATNQFKGHFASGTLSIESSNFSICQWQQIRHQSLSNWFIRLFLNGNELIQFKVICWFNAVRVFLTAFSKPVSIDVDL